MTSPKTNSTDRRYADQRSFAQPDDRCRPAWPLPADLPPTSVVVYIRGQTGFVRRCINRKFAVRIARNFTCPFPRRHEACSDLRRNKEERDIFCLFCPPKKSLGPPSTSGRFPRRIDRNGFDLCQNSKQQKRDSGRILPILRGRYRGKALLGKPSRCSVR